MIIVGDIGNTEVKICFFYNGLKKKYLFKTDSLNKIIIRKKFNFYFCISYIAYNNHFIFISKALTILFNNLVLLTVLLVISFKLVVG